MKNLFGRIGVAPDDDEAIDRAIESVASRPEDLSAESFGELRSLLANPERRAHLRRLHMQYRAIAASLDALDLDNAQDTHRWRERVIEFER